MFIYSKKIIRFVNDIKSTIQKILTQELRLKVHGDRFYNREKTHSYPIKVVIFNHRTMLGYFDSTFLELGFHESLMHTNRAQLHNIIKHEIAHYLTYIKYGQTVQHHGSEFKTFCLNAGWGEDVYRATTCLDDNMVTADSPESIILRKVQKLMALATSSNQNEAESAMIKAQELLLKHNMEPKYIEGEEEEKLVLKRVLKQTKQNSKMSAIATILGTFFVNVVFSRAENSIYIEILGTPDNVEIAEYVAEFLNAKMEELWIQAQRTVGLSGLVAKNSFFVGLALGYCNKVKALKQDYSLETKNALMVIEKQLADAQDLVYKKLKSQKSSASYCKTSSQVGESMGRQLNINPAINKPGKSRLLLK